MKDSKTRLSDPFPIGHLLLFPLAHSRAILAALSCVTLIALPCGTPNASFQRFYCPPLWDTY